VLAGPASRLSHSFRPRTIGQEQRVHTGWLEVDEGGARYAPHTTAGYAMPPSKTLMVVAVGFAMRTGFRKARKMGLVS
jgi:hypothetical protein